LYWGLFLAGHLHEFSHGLFDSIALFFVCSLDCTLEEKGREEEEEEGKEEKKGREERKGKKIGKKRRKQERKRRRRKREERRKKKEERKKGRKKKRRRKRKEERRRRRKKEKECRLTLRTIDPRTASQTSLGFDLIPWNFFAVAPWSDIFLSLFFHFHN